MKLVTCREWIKAKAIKRGRPSVFALSLNGCLLALCWVLCGCGGGSSRNDLEEPRSDSLEPVVAEQDVDQQSQPPLLNTQSIRGRVTFDRVPVKVTGLDYDDIQRLAARQILVQAVNTSNEVIATSLTDVNGSYELLVPNDQALAVRAIAQMEVRSIGLASEGTLTSERRWALVEDNTSDMALYAIQGAFATQQDSSERLLHASAGWEGNGYGEHRQAAPFAMLDSLYLAFEVLNLANIPMPSDAFRIRWSKDNRAVAGEVTDGEIGTSHYNSAVGGLYILGAENSDTDEYDEHVLLHEFAHWLEDRLGRLDSMGGAHSLSEPLDPRLAFSEGWATALSTLLLEDPFYLDSQGSRQSRVGAINVDTQQMGRAGWFNESSVQSLFYDIGDGLSENNLPDDDGVNLGLPALITAYWDTVQNLSPLMSTHPLLFTLKQRHDDQATSLDRLYTGFEVTADDIWGSSEVNAGHLDHSLPIYEPLVRDDSKRVCISMAGGINNKFGNRRLFRTSVDSDGTYEWRAERRTGSSIAYSLVLYHQGRVIGVSASRGTNSQTLRAQVERDQDYVLELISADTNVSGTWCFDTTLTAQ